MVSGCDAGDQVITQALESLAVLRGEHRLRPTQYLPVHAVG